MSKFNIEVDTANKTMSVQKDGEDFHPYSFSLGHMDYSDGCYCYLCYTEKGDDGMDVSSSIYFSPEMQSDASVNFAGPINRTIANVVESIKLSKLLKPQGK